WDANQGYRDVGRDDLTAAGQKTFQLLYTDQDGASTIQRAEVLFNEKKSEVGGCYIKYFPVMNQVQLRNDAGTADITPDGNGMVANGECIVNAGGVWKTTNGSKLTVTIPVTFRLAGPRQTW